MDGPSNSKRSAFPFGRKFCFKMIFLYFFKRKLSWQGNLAFGKEKNRKFSLFSRDAFSECIQINICPSSKLKDVSFLHRASLIKTKQARDREAIDCMHHRLHATVAPIIAKNCFKVYLSINITLKDFTDAW